MQTSLKNLCLLPALIAGLGFILVVGAASQTFTILHSFLGFPTDAAMPYAGVILSSNTLYGTTQAGGSPGYGTVFALNTDGTGLKILHNFAGSSDGDWPNDGLALSGNTLFGTTPGGIVFQVNTDGGGFKSLHYFHGSDGTSPYAEMLLSGNTLYGTTLDGGASGKGTVFAMNTDAWMPPSATPPRIILIAISPPKAGMAAAFASSWPSSLTPSNGNTAPR